LVAAAYGPILADGEVVGLLCLATGNEPFANALVESMPDMMALTAGSSAILADRLQRFRHDLELRQQLEQLLATRAFHPVFQPIVELDGRSVVGYEALTRFSDGMRPDEVFGSAWTVGMGPDLELAALRRALDAADALPAGRWLSVNVSPLIVTGSNAALAGALRDAGRPLVLEITENAPVADYTAFQAALRALGGDIRMAVDDAGAGVANFGHIVEMRPDLVKLDASLVRGVHKRLERQALIRAMVLFARTAGCRLVAEGVETEQEALALVEMDVEFGQGHLFGRPERIGQGLKSARPGRRGYIGLVERNASGWVRFEGPGKLHIRRWHIATTSPVRQLVTYCGRFVGDAAVADVRGAGPVCAVCERLTHGDLGGRT
jgi:EAL domain-containing protein (putative c-di-GMP-specific phosphodiesterase class I)